MNRDSDLTAEEDRTDDDLRALARLIEYATAEARKNGLVLTAHLLELAGWSLRIADADGKADRSAAYEARTDKPN